MSYCQNSELPISAKLDEYVRYHKAGLGDTEVLVMGAYVEVACLDVSEARVKLSAWEVSKRTGLSLAAVKRALSKLLRMELLVRRQDVKAAGVMAWTLVSQRACELMGAKGGVDLAGLPDELKVMLAGESVAVCRGVVEAWRACSSMPAAIESAWHGGAVRCARVRMELASREQQALEKVLEAQQAREVDLEHERAGMVRVTCPGGQDVLVDTRHLDANAPCPADLGFGRDVLHELALRHPELVTPASVPRLLAEILYSRSVGFLSGREYVPALRILVSCIGGAKKPWSRPHGMWEQWYGAAAMACKLSTAGSVSVH